MKILLFDWDGTIVDSNHFKWNDAWQMVFEGESNKQEIIKEVFTRPKGRIYNRWELVREVFVTEGKKQFKGLEGEELNTHPEILKYTERFAKILKNGHKYMNPFEDTRQTLEELKKCGYKMYVITNSLIDVVEMMAKQFGIYDFFEDFYGLPNSKYENFQEIVKIEKTDKGKDYVYIGDGENDKRLADQIDCQFIGIANIYNKWEEDEYMKDLSIKNLGEIFSKL